MLFWLKYVLVAAIGTAVLYCSIPLIHPELYAETDFVVAEADAIVDTLPQSTVVTQTAKSETPAPVRVTAPRPAPAAKQVVQYDDDDDEPEVIVENVTEYKPSTDVIRSSGTGVTHWGITVKETAVYSKDGKNLKTVPGGTLIEQINSTKTDKGEMSYCKIWKDNVWSGPFLIAGADLIRFPGTREQTDANDVDKLCKYFSLVQQYENRKMEILKANASKNPYYKEFKEKAEAYNKNADRSAELTKQRDEAKGAKRTKLIAELSKLKQEEARQSSELSKIKAKYEDWKKKNSHGEFDYNSDPIFQKLGKQIYDLKFELSDFGI